MMRRRSLRWAVAMTAVLATTCGNQAAAGWLCRGGYCQRPPGRPASSRVVANWGTTPAYYFPPAAMTAPTPIPIPAPTDEAGAFLQRLNTWRAAHGRGPVGWDATLAAYASTNSWAGHQPGSTGGAAQCWASHRSLIAALAAWQQSPPHAAILLNATVAVGASLCPSGATCNAR